MNDQNAGLHRVLAANDRKVVGYLIAVGIVRAAVQITDGEANTGNACLGRSELAVAVAGHAKLANAKRIHIEVGIGAGIDVVVAPVVDAETRTSWRMLGLKVWIHCVATL